VTSGRPLVAALAVLLAALHVWFPVVSLAGEPVPEPPGFRMDAYRAPVPATLAGASVLDGAAVAALWRDKQAVFVDVLPRPPKPPDLPAGAVWKPPQRRTIPDAVWLANVGYGVLSEPMEAYFRSNLTELSGGRLDRKLVFFCQRDCWMSWNAAKRAVNWGYSEVIWYPAGTDGWEEMGLPLRDIEPKPTSLVEPVRAPE
jgi:PQQ-dependent catabolism-associated CXXCW motif protein